MDCGPAGSSVRGVPQARVLQWLSFHTPGELPDPGIEPLSLALAGGIFTTETPSSLIRDLKIYISLIVMMENQPNAKILHTHKNAIVVKQLYSNKN